ncbi:hypothetical protein IVG45_06085 [Methylomonas sp. LL1]|uniref:hypothetical protein n=1 Tax=Methylomonas sp. LL1 TaxID=2785785 RepID=UPI0018C3E803|nr:hypothetical protein [Methylomonas sp. LL1]QPK64525.1 hypothetical protein IVG45_06085 [Methylomonas sp. LL1]
MNLNNTPRTEIRRNARWLLCLTDLILVVSYKAVFADIGNPENMLIGVWEGGDRAVHAIYGTMMIYKDSISWGKEKSDPGCEGSYEIVSKDYADSFPGQDKTYHSLPQKRFYNIIKIKLIENTCPINTKYLQFAFPTDIPRYADVVEYDRNSDINGWLHIHKKNEFDAEENRLIGVWKDGTESNRYGTVIINNEKISWGKEKDDPGCEGRYQIISRNRDNTFYGQYKTLRNVPQKRFYDIIKIRLIENTCPNDLEYLQFAFPEDIQSYVDVVEFYRDIKETGKTHFHKITISK